MIYILLFWIWMQIATGFFLTLSGKAYRSIYILGLYLIGPVGLYIAIGKFTGRNKQ